MSDDYLWDRSGPLDAEVAHLEELLRPLGQQELAPLPMPAVPVGGGRRRGTHGFRLGLTAAAAFSVILGGWWLFDRPTTVGPGWNVTWQETSSPAIQPIDRQKELPIGGSLETNGQERALIRVADIGSVSVEPRTRVRLVGTRVGDHRLQLLRGTLRATILAPPGQFVVETPSSTAVDLGCAYTLTVDDEGAGMVTVTSGWVGFEWRGRESFIPAGSMCVTRPGVGPGTPFRVATPTSMREALETIDFRSGSTDAGAALAVVLAEAREADKVTLWHLLTRTPVEERDRVFDRLATFVPPPANVTREGIRAGRQEMLDSWWDALGLGSTSVWRRWQQRWQDNANRG